MRIIILLLILLFSLRYFNRRIVFSQEYFSTKFLQTLKNKCIPVLNQNKVDVLNSLASFKHPSPMGLTNHSILMKTYRRLLGILYTCCFYLKNFCDNSNDVQINQKEQLTAQEKKSSVTTGIEYKNFPTVISSFF